jgi:prepilin signal peptidase PulO-like enzyme (type II secretory pathway)
MFPILFLFLLGLIVGSFLNVVALRWNSGLTLGGRSFCTSCHKPLRFWELVPVFSFLFLRGRCSRCKARISWQYPLIEFSTGVIFASLFVVTQPNDLISFLYYVLSLMIFSIYVVIVIYDLRHKIIPDEFAYTAAVLALVAAYLSGTHTLIDWLAGPLIFTFFGSIWLLSRGRAVGLGDAKLGLSIGLLLGAAQGFSAVVLAFWIGTVSILSYMFLGRVTLLLNDAKRLTMKSEIPFGPFLVLGALIAFVFNLDLLYVSLF